MELDFINIKPVANSELELELQNILDQKTKPVGSLGQLESIAMQLGLIQESTKVLLKNPVMLTVASDHNIIEEGFGSAPAEVTWQQVLNFIDGGGAIGAFCSKVGMELKVVDAGVDYDFDDHPNLIKAKVRRGTRNFLKQHAMTDEECLEAIENGRSIVRELATTGTTIVGFGEMGIGNTSPSSALLSVFSGLDIGDCTGFGAGIDNEALDLKTRTLKKAIDNHGISDSPIENLAKFGGLEIATIVGGILEAAANRMVILIDGFITTAAFLVAYEIEPLVKDYSLFSHSSKEPGHVKMLDHIGAEPILDLGLRLGEGTGAALAFPIVEVAVDMLNNMTSFKEAKVFNVLESDNERR